MSNLTEEEQEKLNKELKQELQQELNALAASNWIFNLGALKAIKDIQLEDKVLKVKLTLPFAWQDTKDLETSFLSTALAKKLELTQVEFDLSLQITRHERTKGQAAISGIKNIIAISSAKGGVGKSTVTINLAITLAKMGLRVGILDADIYGPSIPHMLGIEDKKPISLDNKTMQPLEAHGIYCNSIGFLVDSMDPTIWRGPMASSMLTQLLNETAWDNLDYLLIDMPPGTGDIQLTVSEKIGITGAVIVTTPQEIALLDVVKGINMFKKVNVPILGIVENMQMHTCKNCGAIDYIFGMDGGLELTKLMEIEYLGNLPLNRKIRYALDKGLPSASVVNTEEDTQLVNDKFIAIAQNMATSLYRQCNIAGEAITIKQL